MASVKEIHQYIDQIAPFSLQESWDNSGFLVGEGGKQIQRVLCALDITEHVVEEAVQLHAGLIVTHHPVIFHKLSSVTDESRTGAILLQLIAQNLAVISAHTNLDAAQGGVNDALAQALGLQHITPFTSLQTDCYGRSCGLGRMGLRGAKAASEFSAFAEFVRRRLSADGLRCYDAGRPVEKVAVLGGAGADWLLEAAEKGCDTYITSDISHHHWHDAITAQVNLIDAGHFNTEQVIIPVLAKRLAEQFPSVEFICSQRCQQPYSFY